MLEKALPAQVQQACEDLENRTLVSLPGYFGRLIYLASMRDYNSGQYYHEGLARRFSEPIAAEALARCHRDAFYQLVRSPLCDVVHELDRYIHSAPAEAAHLLETWTRLQPYRVAVPAHSSPALAEFFTSNIKMALLILKRRRAQNS